MHRSSTSTPLSKSEIVPPPRVSYPELCRQKKKEDAPRKCCRAQNAV
ncbi:hypothetical protein JI435_413120 [Parastagonospora nodorum SN15]|uniref:Uncharacterized protein n=1 Tax=Phaeosphaeria nodorum (strain SN15 / ATCC MYA-4574 / FGSC 10173) TaxID=321614 RepID=A0A7U2I4L5_PHANO|nr:hypothetical protein JI435_413120 [Parastagonospora nodorum SN15]